MGSCNFFIFLFFYLTDISLGFPSRILRPHFSLLKLSSPSASFAFTSYQIKGVLKSDVFGSWCLWNLWLKRESFRIFPTARYLLRYLKGPFAMPVSSKSGCYQQIMLHVIFSVQLCIVSEGRLLPIEYTWFLSVVPRHRTKEILE